MNEQERKVMDALVDLTNEMIDEDFVNQGMEAIVTFRTIIEQAEKQEPVAKNEGGSITWLVDDWPQNCLLYTHPQPKREWVGLTKKEFEQAVDCLEDLEDCWIAIEAKLKEKNT